MNHKNNTIKSLLGRAIGTTETTSHVWQTVQRLESIGHAHRVGSWRVQAWVRIVRPDIGCTLCYREFWPPCCARKTSYELTYEVKETLPDSAVVTVVFAVFALVHAGRAIIALGLTKQTSGLASLGQNRSFESTSWQQSDGRTGHTRHEMDPASEA